MARVYKISNCGFCGEEKTIAAKGLCRSCYQRYRKNGTPDYVKVKRKCKIDGCEDFRVSHGLCDKHRQRARKHGHLKLTRPKGWGHIGSHPLYHSWGWHKRRNNLCEEWLDFWTFVQDVGDKPSDLHKLCKIVNSSKLSKRNFEWKLCDGGSRSSSEYAKQWRAKNPAKVKNSRLKKVFGITLDDYHSMLESQNGVCEICGKPETAVNKQGKTMDLAVDHCHTSGKVRGLLCINCNKGVGHFNDSTELLEKAIKYLKQHST